MYTLDRGPAYICVTTINNVIIPPLAQAKLDKELRPWTWNEENYFIHLITNCVVSCAAIGGGYFDSLLWLVNKDFVFVDREVFREFSYMYSYWILKFTTKKIWVAIVKVEKQFLWERIINLPCQTQKSALQLFVVVWKEVNTVHSWGTSQPAAAIQNATTTSATI